MANPYGIEQVDIPSLLNMHQGMKRQRIADLMQAREYELKVKQQEREDRKDQTLARIFTKGGGQVSGAPGAATQTPVSAAPAQPPASNVELPPVADTSQLAPHPLDNHAPGDPLPARTDGLSINMDALRELYAIDPQQAMLIQKTIYDSDKQQLEQATARGEAMAVAADALKAVPQGERQAQFQSRWAPFLAGRGYTADMLSQADLSDQGLDAYYKQGQTLAQVVTKNKPDLRVVPLGGTIYDVNTRGAVTQPAAGPKPGDVVDGYRFKGGSLNDPSAWEEAGSGNATGTFP